MLFQILFSQNELWIGVILFVVIAAALIFSIVMHELGHAYVALWNGDKTAKVNGRLSLNPLRHLDPLGFFMLVFMGFGYAKPVPVNSMNFKHPRRGIFFVSIAGVTVNIILSFFSAGIFIAISTVANPSLFVQILRLFFENLMYFNLVLFFFNLIPLFPLDGFHLIESLSKRNNRFINFMRNYSLYILIVLIGLSVIVDRFAVETPWWQYVDILGTYLGKLSGWVGDAFCWFWGLIF